MQATIEEYETALEELRSSNEELVAINEEAQSTNEELEASKEEMQSLNEELNTINAELSRKIEELDRANNDLKNVFESTQIATVLLDRNLVICSFTPAASKFFHLIPSDPGRPLTDLACHLGYPEFKGDIQAVFDTGEMIEQWLARDENGAHYLVRLIPYREADHAIRGVVVTIIDVTGICGSRRTPKHPHCSAKPPRQEHARRGHQHRQSDGDAGVLFARFPNGPDRPFALDVPCLRIALARQLDRGFARRTRPPGIGSIRSGTDCHQRTKYQPEAETELVHRHVGA
jgi:PAS domain-containing protein